MKNILIVSGHTDIKDSVANAKVLKELAKLIPNAEIDYLDKLYPDYKINVKLEQEKLLKADIIVLQYPIFWYHFPSIMQKWIEQTFQHGFSHGSTGDKLKNKKLIASFTTGAPELAYHKNASSGYEIEEFLTPIKATCKLCGIDFSGFVFTGGVSYQSRKNIKTLNDIRKKSVDHAIKVFELVKKL